jgi:Pyruvate/2-oxoacid:ferredoxin oxidoreductase delta subunit
LEKEINEIAIEKGGPQMKPSDDIYRRLQQHIDRMPIPFPATKSGVELRLLKHLFTPQEAEIALALNAVPEPVERIHKRLRGTHISLEHLGEALANMVVKGAITGGRVTSGGKPALGYGKAPLMVGMYELQVDRLTKEFLGNKQAYMEEGFGNPIVTKKTSQMRTVPINAEVGEPGMIGQYDDIRRYVRGAGGPFGVHNCICRQARSLLGQPCQRVESHETCLTFGDTAVGMQRLGHARLIPREEMLALLDQAERCGLVLQPENSQSPHFICCCCGDCCEVLMSARKMPRPGEYFKTNFQAHVDAGLCEGCKTCVKRCPMDAVSVKDKLATVSTDRCIGCGLCASTCKKAAIRLRPREKQYVPPRDRQAMYQKIMMERYGPLSMIAKGVRMKLGMKL